MLARARAAQPAWAALPVDGRCRALAALRRELARRCHAIAEVIARETAKPLLDALAGDVLVSLEHLRFCQMQAARVLRPRTIRRSRIFYAGTRFEEYREPHGVVLIFGPANYPLQLSLIPATTALVAGNAVILKCSEHTPATAAMIEALCVTAGFPRDLIQIVDEAPEAAASLVDAGPDFIFFTGSSRNGRQVAERAAQQMIPGVFELGGKDPALVFADCPLDRAVEGVTYGAFSNTGRVCVGIRRVYVEAPIYTEFVMRLTDRLARLRVDEGEEADLRPLSAGSQPMLRVQIQEALARGASMLWPPDSSIAGERPTLLANVPADALILTEETFGPVLCIAPFRDEGEAVALANASAFALGSSVWTRDRSRARRVAAQLSGGSCSINDVIRNVGNPWAAFGGNRSSGYGRYRGEEGLRSFTRVKSVMLAGHRRARELHWFPLRDRTARQLARLLRIRHGAGGLVGRLSRLIPILLVSLLPATARATQAHAETQLTIRVHLTHQAHGELAYLIFAAPAGFPGDPGKSLRHGFLPIPGGAQQMTVEAELPPGTYAVSVYEDLNGNHKLDHNFLGIPREPVGVSGNPRARYGPPHFDECSFRVDDRAQTIEIKVVHGI
ncbi:MAG: aldehyde dehydrogenase family protein [Acidobacteriota bacterium]